MSKMYIDGGGQMFCEKCAPSWIEGDQSFGEVDAPMNCSICGARCEYQLTEAGVRYVLDAILEALESPHMFTTLCSGGLPHYNSMPACAVALDWAEDLLDYTLTRLERYVVMLFILKARAACKRVKKKNKKGG